MVGEIKSPHTRVLAIIGGITLLRLAALWFNRTDLFFDESQYWAWSKELAMGYYSKPPLIAWLINLATGVCGDGEFCIRLPAVLLHAATAYLVYHLGCLIYSTQTGVWSAAAYATLPGVSVSSGIISTDVPLLFAWALMLISIRGLERAALLGGGEDRSIGVWVLLLGIAIGFGLNAKYAMAFAALCMAVYVWIEPDARLLLRTPAFWTAVAIGVVLIVPNLIWNAEHSFATFSHTADNAKWEGQIVNPGKAAEFFVAQFGVFGPILFATLIAFLWRVWSGRETVLPWDKLLLAFSLPVIAIVTVQAFISRAHPNWAAVAYVPAVVLVTEYMFRSGAAAWARRSLILNSALAILIAVATASAGMFTLPGIGDPFAKMLGNDALGAAVRAEIEAKRQLGHPYAAILTEDREVTATLLYYAREETTPLYAWRAGPKPHDHFEMKRPYTSASGEPVLLVSRKADPSGVTGAFSRVEPAGSETIASAGMSGRTYHFFALSGYRTP